MYIDNYASLSLPQHLYLD